MLRIVYGILENNGMLGKTCSLDQHHQSTAGFSHFEDKIGITLCALELSAFIYSQNR